MIRYMFREDEPVRIKAAGKANPQVIGEALEKITEAAGGVLKPQAVVEAARRKTHPLHPHFEWDDALAAEAFRLDQARNLIRIVRIEDEATEEGSVRAFVSVADHDNGVAYRTVDNVKRSAELQIALLKSAERDLEAFERRYRSLADICQIVRTARENVAAKLGSDKSEKRMAA